MDTVGQAYSQSGTKSTFGLGERAHLSLTVRRRARRELTALFQHAHDGGVERFSSWIRCVVPVGKKSRARKARVGRQAENRMKVSRVREAFRDREASPESKVKARERVGLG